MYSRTLVITLFLIAMLPIRITHAASTSTQSWMFDFGCDNSPVAEGYIQVSNTMLYDTTRGYGLDRETSCRDRGTPDPVRRDFTNSSNYNFLLDVPNGDYQVTIIAGDAIASNNTSVMLEGQNVGTISSRSGSFGELTTVTRVMDTQLTMGFGRDGRVNGVIVIAIPYPTGLRLEDRVLIPDPSVTISWNPVEEAINYNIYRAEGNDGFERIGSTTKSSYVDTTVELGLSYRYAVTQVNSRGIESAKSNVLTINMWDESHPAPRAPQGIELDTATRDALEFSWNPVDDAILYYVYRSKNPTGPFERIGAISEAQYRDNLNPTINYYYQVRAVGIGGLSLPSETLKTPITKTPIRRMEKISRAPIAVHTDNGILVSWRLLASDPPNIAFDVYRNGHKINKSPIRDRTNYLDRSGDTEAVYTVKPIVRGHIWGKIESTTVWEKNYLDVPLHKPQGGVTPDGVEYTYSANDASVGDLDGDGDYEIVLKWDPSNSKDNSQAGYTGEVLLDAYELDGSLLWRINLGKNIRAGAHYTQFLVYDFDGDGKAEVVAKTADGTIDGTGRVIGDPNADYRNSEGRILEGPEYLTVFDGLTGRALATTNYDPPRGNVCDWGDCYGNRVDRFLAGVAYLDGQNPSFIMARGYYTRTVLVAYNWRDNKITKLWKFDSATPGYESYAGQGNHQLSVGDVDNDGRDEIIYGSMAIDDDGSPMYSTGLGHGDAMHLGDLDPQRPGLEVFQVHENANSPYGYEMHDAATGEILWGVRTGIDTGRGLAADIDPRYIGYEAWAVKGEWNSPTGGLHTANGDKISDNIPPANFAIWWDGDLTREILDHNWSQEQYVGVGTIGKWDYEHEKMVNLLTAHGTYSNNGTKGNPSLQADIFGDWREEVIWRTEDSSALRIYTTPYPTEYRFVTLMQDPIYRLGIAWQNVGYNQPPHTSFYLGSGMPKPSWKPLSTDEPIKVKLDLYPNRITHTNEKHNTLRALIRFPADIQGDVVAANSIHLLVDGDDLSPKNSRFGKVISKGNAILVPFRMNDLVNAAAEYTGKVEITILGYTQEGKTFWGTALIRVGE
ncbi:FG-GAP repeat protein [Thermobaculum terrenum ATCC BAA-798]|uniref:FG-GAP repeat protein n=1 Tax=Thermobaculum terrenum (strain ATCC BAA-798 / CCMEE 7001 / YNP1) TaxID=525904 RepID=D1CB51_THET1|nr:FG-GAP repeat protein [Thermobaculum terrenum ATCC BAA-798]